jgi:hypothetical protein
MTKTQIEKDEYLLSLQSKLEEANKTFTGEINETNRALLNQLFVAAGGFITLASALLVTKETRDALACDRGLLVMAIFLSIASLGCGLAQFYIDICFWRAHKKNNAQIVELISEDKIDSPKQLKALLNNQDDAGERSNSGWLITQFALLALSAVAIVWIIYDLLFKSKLLV